MDDLEIVFASYSDAEAYCRWRSGHLPTAEQWEIAGRGKQGFLYPWGNEWREKMGPRFMRVDLSPDMAEMYWQTCTSSASRSPFGVEDQSGYWPEFVRGEPLEVRGSTPELIKRPEDHTLVKRHHPEPDFEAAFRCVYPVADPAAHARDR